MDNKQIKICSSCKIEKNYIDFNKNKLRKDGYQNTCISCNKMYMIKKKMKFYEKKKNIILIIKKKF